MNYESVMVEQFKKDQQVIDNELAVTAAKFLTNPDEYSVVWHYIQVNRG